MDLSSTGAFPGSRPANMGRMVINRTLGPATGLSRHQQADPLQNYMISRLKVRARFQLSQDGCSFALKFAENFQTGEVYCLLTHGSTMQVWEMSGVYTKRRPGQLHGANLLMSAREHADVVSSVEWMPSSFSESFEPVSTPIPPQADRSLQRDAPSLRRRSVVTSREIFTANATRLPNFRIPAPPPLVGGAEQVYQNPNNTRVLLGTTQARDTGSNTQERMNIDHEGDATNSSSDSISSQEIDEEEENPRRNIVCLPPFFTAGFDKEIRCYRNGDCVARLTEHKDWVRFMSVNQDGSRMLSGSVNSNIFGWDTTTCRPVFTITPAHEAPSHLQHSLQGINSINGLEWTHAASPVFASGAGDGSIKLWDARTLSSQSNTFASVGTILAHDGKLNNLLWLQDDRFMLSSGRDDVIRLLDMRMIGDCSRGISDNLSSHGSPLTRDRLVIREYTGHTCSGYNIQAALWDKDRFIVTGSRDGKIHVFETSTGKLVNLLSGPVQPTHLVVPLPERCGPGLISATAVSAHIFVWGPASTTENTPESDLVPADVEDDDSLVEMARQEALENTISQFGERFLRALRQDGAGSRVFFDDQVRSVYYHHMYHALQRRGRTHLVFPANYQPPQIQQGPQQPGPQDPRGPNAMAEG